MAPARVVIRTFVRITISNNYLEALVEFTHLHVASGYSFKYGTALPEALVARAAELEMSTLALTDRVELGALAGAIRFTQACAKKSIKPILGGDFLIAPPLTLRRPSTTRSATQPPPVKGGAAVEKKFPRATDLAEQAFNQWSEFFPRDLITIETVSHRVPGVAKWSTHHGAKMLLFGRMLKAPVLLSNNVRMLQASDAPVAEVLDAIRKLVPLSSRHIENSTDQAYLKSSAEMFQIAREIAQSAGEKNEYQLLATTLEWAQRCELSPTRDIGLGGVHLPEPDVVGLSSYSEMAHHLKARCEVRLTSRYFGEKLTLATERLHQELQTVNALGYEAYFLAVADIVDSARRSSIRVAARGSGAGSLICHLLGISGVDPLEHGLLMERFCSTLRTDLPDIDIDVESARRLEIYDQVFARYNPTGSWPHGPARSTTVAMVETYRARHAIRDVGAALALPHEEIDALAKSLPHIRAKNITNALRDLPELRHISINAPMGKAIALAQQLDKLPRHLSMHPCAVILADSALLDRMPSQIGASGYPMSQWDKDDVESVGLLKLDILGVRMQSAMAHALHEIKRVDQKSIPLDDIPLNDPETFTLIRSTKTLGIFQIESPGQRELIGKFAPEVFNDLIIDISLFRPGPVKSDMITPFLNARQGWRKPHLIHPSLYEILAETEGVVVFHEQVIRIIATIADISLAKAESYRRLLNDPEGGLEFYSWFAKRASERGYSGEVIAQVSDVLRAFASFGFCKAHAAAFALPTYQSAWLKTHYPAHFIAGLLTHDPGMYPKRLLLDEARQLGVLLLPLSINSSEGEYKVEQIESSYGIRLALSDISGINEREIAEIISGRPFIDLADFVYRARISQPIVEHLILLGAFDELHPTINRRDLLLHYAEIDRWSGPSSGQIALPLLSGDSVNNRAIEICSSGLPALTESEKVRNEISLLGLDVSHHLIDFYHDLLRELGVVQAADLLRYRSKTPLLVAGVKVALQSPPVRSGRRVIFITLDDGTGCSDATFFEGTQIHSGRTLYRSRLLLVQGVLRRTGPRGVSIIANCAWDLAELHVRWRESGDIAALRDEMDTLINISKRKGESASA
ncbi:MAG: DNA polymerase III subunit alpha [Actinobacteria bacterium]|uniref:DNA-directed DNA polymerase n=1 Tax=Candidatus Fonsibacter lacus TaxID=2576439 RepID=A0A965GDI2_9PROT|nr:DNA polymerase III subunit alpha [Candidatus Fonsibacter lacus]